MFEELNHPEMLSISEEIKKEYPSVTLGFAIIKGVKIVKTNPELEKEKNQLLSELKGLTTEKINDYPEVQSYRKMYKQMGIDWHSRRPSPEALLRRVAQGKPLYNVNTCVDAYNIAVMHNRVSVGAFDLNQVQFPTILQIATGGEQILLLGDDEPTTLKPNEVSYFDADGPYNLDFNYRDAQRTMVTMDTTDLLINVDGVHDITRAQVESTLQETIELIQKYCGGTVTEVGILMTK
jgi:DNA/RNA-binding domain of Phe-tRNA-synthetase-like protein